MRAGQGRAGELLGWPCPQVPLVALSSEPDWVQTGRPGEHPEPARRRPGERWVAPCVRACEGEQLCVWVGLWAAVDWACGEDNRLLSEPHPNAWELHKSGVTRWTSRECGEEGRGLGFHGGSGQGGVGDTASSDCGRGCGPPLVGQGGTSLTLFSALPQSRCAWKTRWIPCSEAPRSSSAIWWS